MTHVMSQHQHNSNHPQLEFMENNKVQVVQLTSKGHPVTSKGHPVTSEGQHFD